MSLKIFIFPLIFFLSGQILAQDGYKATHEGWYVDIEDAYKESKETGKPIMANFTGSDWCGWCKKLSSAVFNKSEFQNWADENVVLLELDFPRRFAIPADLQKQNNSLKNAFKVSGFPTIWVFHLNKKEDKNSYEIEALGKTGYVPTVDEFTSGVDRMIEKKS